MMRSLARLACAGKARLPMHLARLACMKMLVETEGSPMSVFAYQLCGICVGLVRKILDFTL